MFSNTAHGRGRGSHGTRQHVTKSISIWVADFGCNSVTNSVSFGDTILTSMSTDKGNGVLYCITSIRYGLSIRDGILSQCVYTERVKIG